MACSKMVGLGFVLGAATLVGCGADSKQSGDGGDDPSGGSGASGGTTGTGGSGPTGGSAGSSAGTAGSGGMLTCLPGVAGVWAAVGFPAYLDIDSACRVNMFCDIPNDYHTTGYVNGDLLVLIDVAMVFITVEGDVLTVIDAEPGIDLPFARQPSAAAIPPECRI